MDHLFNKLYRCSCDRMQRTNIALEYSSWKENKNNFPQGSIFGLIFSSIDLSDFFFIMKDVDIACELKIPLS